MPDLRRQLTQRQITSQFGCRQIPTPGSTTLSNRRLVDRDQVPTVRRGQEIGLHA